MVFEGSDARPPCHSPLQIPSAAWRRPEKKPSPPHTQGRADSSQAALKYRSSHPARAPESKPLIDHRRGNIPEPPQPRRRHLQPRPEKKTPSNNRRTTPDQPDARKPQLKKTPVQTSPRPLDGDGATATEAGKEREDKNPQRSRRRRHTDCTWEPKADELLDVAANNAEMGLELRHLYWTRRRCHHQSAAAQTT